MTVTYRPRFGTDEWEVVLRYGFHETILAIRKTREQARQYAREYARNQ
jgi:hypothetical protein